MESRLCAGGSQSHSRPTVRSASLQDTGLPSHCMKKALLSLSEVPTSAYSPTPPLSLGPTPSFVTHSVSDIRARFPPGLPTVPPDMGRAQQVSMEGGKGILRQGLTL